MRGGLLDAFMQMFRKRPFRCRSCRRRFYCREDEAVPQDSEHAEASGAEASSETHDHQAG